MKTSDDLFLHLALVHEDNSLTVMELKLNVLQAALKQEFPGFSLYLFPSTMSDQGLTIFMNVTAKDQITSGAGIMSKYGYSNCQLQTCSPTVLISAHYSYQQIRVCSGKFTLIFLIPILKYILLVLKRTI